MTLLKENFNSHALEQVMCKSLLSISWDGKIYDCDFNQMLNMPCSKNEKNSIWDINSFEEFVSRKIKVADHCFGCTAGAGSSCSGSIF